MTPSEILKALGLVYYAPNLSSPEGQQKIRDRVRELCDHLSYYYFDETHFPESAPHMVIVVAKGPAALPSPPIHYSTESAAWLAALEFLWKEKEK